MAIQMQLNFREKSSYNEIVAVNNMNLSINTGEIFALLGPNGSGKSTTLKMLIGLVQLVGAISVLGIDARPRRG
jgi:ABC-2 type transport system ATP-binding protein